MLYCNPSVRLYVCLSRSLDDAMLTLLFQMHLIGGSTISYARIQMLSAWAHRFAARYLVRVTLATVPLTFCSC